MSEILISYEPARQHREIFARVLSGEGNLTFLTDVAEEERRSALENADIILAWSPAKEFSRDEFGLLERVRLIQLVTAGADHLPFASLPRRALVASNPGAYAGAMAEHVLAMVLCIAKRLRINNEKLKEGVFDQQTRTKLLRGRSFGVVGYGGIGKAASALMRSLGLKVLAINTSGGTADPVEFVGTLDDLDHVLRQSDVLLLSIPLTQRTKGLIGSRELHLMKKDATLVNVARGAIIDEKALYGHLAQNPDFNAAIDTWWVEPQTHGAFRVNFPFFDLPNFLGSPHNSAVAPGVMRNAVGMACENVVRFLGGEPVWGVVNSADYVGE